ncbi:helix-turn-helix domain-containing protein [Mycobacterium sp. MYCO198283]|uniref:helix-turn-helix domain-containing protein n=1 Tax=Mycobacterium sp. MYCO198283 TaxID=2883505 RepID=UPI001E425C00|nr:helix-turn-helix domain-containing protein [Mycobacterium sp. MYCO198283]MCG5431807.1 helix-turn-helix domain-containing protein [Mycobacterium sp. MYCO198283]
MPVDGIAPQTLSTQQAANALGCSLNTLYKLLETGSLHSFRVGRRLRIRLSDLEQFMANGGTR